LREGEVSRWHRIDAVEIWHFYRGAPLELAIAEDAKPPARWTLGSDVENGEHPQLVVPPGPGRARDPWAPITLVGCTVAAGFEFSTFELAPPGLRPLG